MTRFLGLVVCALLMMQGALHATDDEASFHCVVKSAYYADRGDQPAPTRNGIGRERK
jgi:hypothetical protein